jgi:plastocyanin
MRSMTMVLAGTAIVGLSLFLAACNNPKVPVENPGTGTTPVTTPGGATDVIACTIKTPTYAFTPNECNIKVGDKVSIEGSPLHPVLANAAGGPIDATTRSTVTKIYTFTSAGKFTFFCTNHSNMTATINVTAN